MQKEINTLKSEMSQLEQNYTSKLENLETRRAKDIQSAKGRGETILVVNKNSLLNAENFCKILIKFLKIL